MSMTIGIVGGMGTYAGIDLLTKIADNTAADLDQEHLSVIMISEPQSILDRSEYLLGQISENPGYAIGELAFRLTEAGAELIALPCNTAHVPEILANVEERIPEGIRLINMIEEVAQYLAIEYSSLSKVGILGTNGVYQSKVYSSKLEAKAYKAIYPDKDAQYNIVHTAIYDPEYGIKAQSNPVTRRAREDLINVARKLIGCGAEVLVMACTEIPLAISEAEIDDIPIIDASDVLAKALVREANGICR